MLFAQFDQDDRGRIDSQALKGLCAVLGIDPSIEEHAVLLETLDADGNGTISFEDFVVFWEMTNSDVEGVGAPAKAAAMPAPAPVPAPAPAPAPPRGILKHRPHLVESAERKVLSIDERLKTSEAQAAPSARLASSLAAAGQVDVKST